MPGVRLRNNKKAGPFPEPEDDSDLPFFEAQLNAAHADPEDELLEVLFRRFIHLIILMWPAPLFGPTLCQGTLVANKVSTI